MIWFVHNLGLVYGWIGDEPEGTHVRGLRRWGSGGRRAQNSAKTCPGCRNSWSRARLTGFLCPRPMGILLALAGCALASCGRCFRPKGLRSLPARRGALARPEWLRRPAFISPSPRDFVASLRHPCPPAAGFANRHKNSATEQARRAVFIPLCGEGGIRTPGTVIPYVSLANWWFKPLTHLTLFTGALPQTLPLRPCCPAMPTLPGLH